MPDSPPTAQRICNAKETNARRHLPGLLPAELAAWLEKEGQPRYRADQILDWIFRKHATSFAHMSNLSKTFRTWLDRRAAIYAGCVERSGASADGTGKLLITWPDRAAIETVWIPAADRNTVCLSSQVGCPVGCTFCASGLDGVQRNLTAGEIVEQALQVSRLVVEAANEAPDSAASDARLSNIVLMGMGEPLANYREVIKAVRILNAPQGLNIGARKITLSTVGLPKQIRQLAREDLQLNLALSLHAPDDELRARLIPWGRGVKIVDLIDACRDYFEQTGREVTLEYVLLAGVNTAASHADGLVTIAKRLRANVNLLRYNPVPGLRYQRPTAQSAFDFQRRLRAQGVNAHVRTSRGTDVNAACGQLRRAAAADDLLPEGRLEPRHSERSEESA